MMVYKATNSILAHIFEAKVEKCFLAASAVLITFSLSTIKDDVQEPAVVITDFLLFNESVPLANTPIRTLHLKLQSLKQKNLL